MTAPVSLRRAAGLFGAILLSAALASPGAARDGAMTVAQNPPNPPDPTPPAPGEETPKEHRKDRGDKGQQPQQQQQQGPQGAAPGQSPNPANAQPQPGPGPGPQGEPQGRHRRQEPVEQPQVQQPPIAPKVLPPVQQVVPQQQQVAPQQPERFERKRPSREDRDTPPVQPVAPQQEQQVVPQQPQVVPQQQVTPQQPERFEKKRPAREDRDTPPVQQQPKVVTPPAAPPSPFSAVPGVQPSPATPQLPPGVTPFVPFQPNGAAPGRSQAPQGTPFAPAPQGVAPTPAPGNAQVPDTGFKRRSRTDQGQRSFGTAPERAVLPQAQPPQGAQPNFSPKFTPGFQPPGQAAQRLQDLQRNRTQRTEAGGKRTVIEEPDNRVIVRQDNRVFVRHDETARLATRAQNVRSQRRSDGTTETVILRPGGVQVFNVVDGGGRLVRRYRRDGRGREINIIDNRRFYQGAAAGLAIAAGVGIAAEVLGLHLGPPRIGIPRERYIVDYDRASDDDLYEALTAPPIDRLDRAYSLEEIRYNAALRDRMRRIDLDTINFEFGAWAIAPDQYRVLARIANGINRAVDRNPGEVFLIEGYTDAVGSDIDNLSLSDRRAQSVAEILTEDFDVPPENLVTQGYGEEYLKIPTPGPERANRRVAVRRITPLMAEGGYR
jgi:outer membrane protein OmpA-like peptidoglycan-associated protein